jgi:hypothetical protein
MVVGPHRENGGVAAGAVAAAPEMSIQIQEMVLVGKMGALQPEQWRQDQGKETPVAYSLTLLCTCR